MTEPTDTTSALWDLEQLRQLKARYFRLLDAKRWDEWGQVFTEDVVVEVPEADLVVHGREEVVRTVSAALEGTTTVHQGTMPELTLTGADTAEGIWSMTDYVEWPGSGPERAGLRGYGSYHERYVRTPEGWRIAATRLERLRIDPLE